MNSTERWSRSHGYGEIPANIFSGEQDTHHFRDETFFSICDHFLAIYVSASTALHRVIYTCKQGSFKGVLGV